MMGLDIKSAKMALTGILEIRSGIWKIMGLVILPVIMNWIVEIIGLVDGGRNLEKMAA